jgi:hypothetical protein
MSSKEDLLSTIKHVRNPSVDSNRSVSGCIDGAADLVEVLVCGEVPEVLGLWAHFAGACWAAVLAFGEGCWGRSDASDESEEGGLVLHVESL